ncbi:TolC family protein [Tenacibaculum sp. C7A-26P2]|uniref:TolC family protein n=1 Tax=Tenacibaculum sp. C7A-26P2 TaxID=3447504 RepID=UPI003F82AD4D
MKKLLFFFYLISLSLFSQKNSDMLSLEEYLGYVKKFHPIVKQAKLISSEGEVKLMKARGGFDPKIEIDFDKKLFKQTRYYNKLSNTFKIPTWYGVEIKANYETNDGIYLNPELKTPKEGLLSAGVSMSLMRGLLINDRMAALKKAKLFNLQTKQEQKILINKIIYEATKTYFKWLKSYRSKEIYLNYLSNAQTRLLNIKKSFESGDKPAIDTLEASINLKNRKLDLEKAKINYIKIKLETSNFLWTVGNTPLELKEEIYPDNKTIKIIDQVLNSSIKNANQFNIEYHPKLIKLELKKKSMIVEKKLRLNNLLPKLDIQYNFLSSKYRSINSFNTSNYKGGIKMNFPLFLRKERGELKLIKLKIKELNFDIATNKVNLKNKINATVKQIESYEQQYIILNELITDYESLVKSEERKFSLGEGSLFLVNYREVKLIENQLKFIDTEYKYLLSKSELLRTLNKYSI